MISFHLNPKNMKLENLDIYCLSLNLSDLVWEIFEQMDWRTKKIIGDQIIRSVDSVGANIAEGYGRYHFLDKIKFYYNSRGSLSESRHWVKLLYARKIINLDTYNNLEKLINKIYIKLNNLISVTYKNKLLS